MARTHSNEFFHCNNCGEEVNLKAKVCPHCGADDETAWKDGTDSYLVQEEEFDYDEFVAREHGTPQAKVKPTGMKWWVWVLAVLLLGVIILKWIGRV
jgi:hypothetical protein